MRFSDMCRGDCRFGSGCRQADHGASNQSPELALAKEDILSPGCRYSGKVLLLPLCLGQRHRRDFFISYQAASTLISQLEGTGILKEITGRKRNKRYINADYLSHPCGY